MTSAYIAILPIVVVELGFVIFALADLAKRPYVRTFNKPLWALIIVVFNLFGSVFYLLYGRQEPPV